MVDPLAPDATLDQVIAKVNEIVQLATDNQTMLSYLPPPIKQRVDKAMQEEQSVREPQAQKDG